MKRPPEMLWSAATPAPADHRQPTLAPMKEIAGTISVVVPVFNEANGLRGFHEQLITALIPLSRPVEILYINDGSTDQTRAVLESLRALDPKVGVANFSRNFGKEAAMTAGLNLARGEAVILIDADLQDPPRLIPEMVQAWEGGADVVTMRRRSRAGETWFKTLSAFAFYRVFNMVSDTSMPADVGDFDLPPPVVPIRRKSGLKVT